MRKLIFFLIAIMVAGSSQANTLRTAECRSQLQDCYEAITAQCGANFRVVDRQTYTGDILIRELPGPAVFNTIIFECEKG